MSNEYKLEEPGFGDDYNVPTRPSGEDRHVAIHGRRDGDGSDSDDDDDAPTYTPEQLTSLLPPVSITMLLASIIIVNVRSDDIDDLLTTSLGTYAVSSYLPASSNSTDSEDDDSFWFALLNAAVIIVGIAILTFGIVLCYKFKCYKFLYAFFTFTIFVALGFETGQILYAFFEKFQVVADWASLSYLLYNFAVVGAVGILYGKIVPRILAQGYLICISICICYLLRYFPEWTGWVLLVLLALWDLFAVLAPCGPLKALVKMASERQDPIPGLLYTANASADTEIRVARTEDDETTDEEEDENEGGSNDRRNSGADASEVRVRIRSSSRAVTQATEVEAEEKEDIEAGSADDNFGFESDSDQSPDDSFDEEVLSDSGADAAAAPAAPAGVDVDVDEDADADADAARVAQLESDAELAQRLHDEELSERAAAALAAEESSGFGGATVDEEADAAAAAATAAAAAEDEEEESHDKSVKLGLGDFIFYSLLVGKAALAGWVSFAICFVVILCGLLSTMILLALLKKPLPALPFSMLFGVTFFFWAQYTLDPQAAFMVLSGTYV